MARVIIVEDEEIFRESLTGLLSIQGHEVHAVGTAEEAFSVAGGFVPDVLIVDWMLRGHEAPGLEIARELRKKLPRLQTIVVSGYPADDLRALCGDFPVYAFVEKPFDADEIRSLVAEAAAVR